MQLLRCLFFFVAAFDIELWSVHLPGVCNGAADALSRNNHTSFLAQVPSARRHSARDVGGPGNQTPPRLDVAKLDRASQAYFSKGLADSTQRTYGLG